MMRLIETSYYLIAIAESHGIDLPHDQFLKAVELFGEKPSWDWAAAEEVLVEMGIVTQEMLARGPITPGTPLEEC